MSGGNAERKNRYFHPNRTQPFIITFFQAILAFKRICKKMRLKLRKIVKHKNKREKTLFQKEMLRGDARISEIWRGKAMISMSTLLEAKDQEINPYYHPPPPKEEDKALLLIEAKEKEKIKKAEDDAAAIVKKKTENIIFKAERQITKHQIESAAVSRPMILEDKLNTYVQETNAYYRGMYLRNNNNASQNNRLLRFKQPGVPLSRPRKQSLQPASHHHPHPSHHSNLLDPASHPLLSSKKRNGIQMTPEEQLTFHDHYKGLFQAFVSQAPDRSSTLPSVTGDLVQHTGMPSLSLLIDTGKANEVAGFGGTTTEAHTKHANHENDPPIYTPLLDGGGSHQILEHGDYVEGTTLYYGSIISLQARHGGFLSFSTSSMEVKASGHKILPNCKYIIKKSEDLNDSGIVKYGHALWLQAVVPGANTNGIGINGVGGNGVQQCVLGAQYASLTQGTNFHQNITTKHQLMNSNHNTNNNNNNNNKPTSATVTTSTTTTEEKNKNVLKPSSSMQKNTTTNNTNDNDASQRKGNINNKIQPLLIPFQRLNMLKAQQYGRWIILNRDDPLGTLGQSVSHLDKIILEQEWYFLASNAPGSSHMYKSNLNNSDEIMELILSSYSSQLIMKSGILQINLLNMQKQLYTLHQEREERFLKSSVSSSSLNNNAIQSDKILLNSMKKQKNGEDEDNDKESDAKGKKKKKDKLSSKQLKNGNNASSSSSSEDEEEGDENNGGKSRSSSGSRRKRAPTVNNAHDKKTALVNTSKMMKQLFHPNDECSWKIHLVKLPSTQNDYYRSNQDVIINANNQIIYSSENRLKKNETLLNSLQNQLHESLREDYYIYDHYPKYAALPFNEEEIENIKEMTKGTGLEHWSKQTISKESGKAASPVRIGSPIHKQNSRSPNRHHLESAKETNHRGRSRSRSRSRSRGRKKSRSGSRKKKKSSSRSRSRNLSSGSTEDESDENDDDNQASTMNGKKTRKTFDYKSARFKLTAQEEEFYYLSKYSALQKNDFLNFAHSKEFLGKIYGSDSEIVKLTQETKAIKLAKSLNTTESLHHSQFPQKTGSNWNSTIPSSVGLLEQFSSLQEYSNSNVVDVNNSKKKDGKEKEILPLEPTQWKSYTTYTNAQLLNQMNFVSDGITKDMLGTTDPYQPIPYTVTNNNQQQQAQGKSGIGIGGTKLSKITLMEQSYWQIAQYLLLSPTAYSELPYFMSKYYELNYLKKLYAAKIIKKYFRFFYMQKLFGFEKEMTRIDLVSLYRIKKKEDVKKKLMAMAGIATTSVTTNSSGKEEKEDERENGGRTGGHHASLTTTMSTKERDTEGPQEAHHTPHHGHGHGQSHNINQDDQQQQQAYVATIPWNTSTSPSRRDSSGNGNGNGNDPAGPAVSLPWQTIGIHGSVGSQQYHLRKILSMSMSALPIITTTDGNNNNTTTTTNNNTNTASNTTNGIAMINHPTITTNANVTTTTNNNNTNNNTLIRPTTAPSRVLTTPITNHNHTNNSTHNNSNNNMQSIHAKLLHQAQHTEYGLPADILFDDNLILEKPNHHNSNKEEAKHIKLGIKFLQSIAKSSSNGGKTVLPLTDTSTLANNTPFVTKFKHASELHTSEMLFHTQQINGSSNNNQPGGGGGSSRNGQEKQRPMSAQTATSSGQNSTGNQSGMYTIHGTHSVSSKKHFIKKEGKRAEGGGGGPGMYAFAGYDDLKVVRKKKK